LAALRTGERVLDVACGTGLVSFQAAACVGPNGAVVGTDISEGMVAAAQREAERRQFSWVRFHRADAEDSFDGGSGFDAALCALGLMYFPDPVTALGRMRESLRSGGRVAAAVWGERRRCGWEGIFPVVDKRVQSDVCPMFFQLGTGDNLATAFCRAGLSDVRVERIAVTLHYATAEEACGAAFAGGPVALAYSRFDQQTREEAHAEYLGTIAEYRNGSGYNVPGEFVVAVGWPAAMAA
jgi:ubiquinone/menaquinone biosynthesis C-methylase UbiE